MTEPAPSLLSREDRSKDFRRRAWQIFLGALGVLVLYELIRRAGAANVWETLAAVRLDWLLVWLGVETMIFIGLALRWRMLLRSLRVEVPLTKLVGVRLAGLAVGTLTPGAKLGGEPLRAYLLARDGTPGGPAVAKLLRKHAQISCWVTRVMPLPRNELLSRRSRMIYFRHRSRLV